MRMSNVFQMRTVHMPRAGRKCPRVYMDLPCTGSGTRTPPFRPPLRERNGVQMQFHNFHCADDAKEPRSPPGYHASGYPLPVKRIKKAGGLRTPAELGFPGSRGYESCG